MADEAMIRRFEELGPDAVRSALSSGSFPPSFNVHALEWLAKKDKEAQWRTEELRAEEIEIARSARDAALEANTLAVSANDVAREANDIAHAASASAARSAEAARTNNMIATLALIAAVIAIAISIIGIFIRH